MDGHPGIKGIKTPRRQEQKRTSPYYTLGKTIGIQNKEEY
jgi:hypothetical protein